MKIKKLKNKNKIMVTVFLLCYNEEVLLPHTIAHYKKYIPSCEIVIYDNYSTDDSVKIAKENGCKVIQWKSEGIDDFKYLIIKNNCWKNKEGWVIVADMDEWLCVTENDLKEEESKNTCILRVKGYNMIGRSRTPLLTDIYLHDIQHGVFFPEESKSLCFYRPAILEMNYGPGAHRCFPRLLNEYTKSKNVYSKKEYINKHMDYLGLPFIQNKMIKRYERSKRMRTQYKLATHYTNNLWEIRNKYISYLRSSKILPGFRSNMTFKTIHSELI